MFLKFRFSRLPLPKQDIICLSILALVVIFTRSVLLMNAPSMYFFDSYSYVDQALDFIQTGQIILKPSLPFILTLSFFLQLFNWLAPSINVVQAIMVSFSVMATIILYLIGKKMVGTMFALIASILAAFEQYFMSFSIVGHNDVFAISMGLASFYFATLNKKLQYVLTPILFYIVVGTRPELYPVFLVPIILLNVYKNWKSNLRQKLLLTLYLTVIYVLPALWIYTILPTYTRFSPIQRIMLFLNPELIGVTFNSVFKFYSQDILNNIFVAFCFLGVFVWFVRTFGGFAIFKKAKQSIQAKTWFTECKNSFRMLLNSERVVIGICIFLIFAVYFLVLVTYGFGYTITDGQLTVIPTISERYLILPRLLLSFSLAFPLYLGLRWIYVKII